MKPITILTIPLLAVAAIGCTKPTTDSAVTCTRLDIREGITIPDDVTTLCDDPGASFITRTHTGNGPTMATVTLKAGSFHWCNTDQVKAGKPTTADLTECYGRK